MHRNINIVAKIHETRTPRSSYLFLCCCFIFGFFPLWAATEVSDPDDDITQTAKLWPQINYKHYNHINNCIYSKDMFIKITTVGHLPLGKPQSRLGERRGRVFDSPTGIWKKSLSSISALLVCVRVFSCHVLRLRPLAPGVAPISLSSVILSSLILTG